MVKWSSFVPSDFEYDFENDKLAAHQVSFEEAVECFFSDFQIRRNKKHKDRYQLTGETFGGRKLKIIFQLKPGNVIRVHYRVAVMKSTKEIRTKPTEEKIDAIIESQADDESAWEEPVDVRRAKRASLSLPAQLAARAEFFAKLHREKKTEDWLAKVIEERVELEEVAFNQVKREISLRNGR